MMGDDWGHQMSNSPNHGVHPVIGLILTISIVVITTAIILSFVFGVVP